MYKIAICGKANSGKNTLANLIFSQLRQDLIKQNLSIDHFNDRIKCMAFADPIKDMIQIMFPTINKEHLYGSSALRGSTIPGAFKDGEPLTVRQVLIDIGTGLGRNYNSNIWIDNFICRMNSYKEANYLAVVVSDVRFINEFDHLKDLGFYQIRLLRDSHLRIDHISETNQDGIPDHKFNYVVHNNGTLQDLESETAKIFNSIKNFSKIK